MRLIATLFLSMWLSGCTSTTPLTLAEYKPVTEQAKLAKAYFSPNEQRTEKVLIGRDGGWMGSLVTLEFVIEGQPVALLDPEEIITLYLEPRPYLVTLRPETNYLGEPDGNSELHVTKEMPNNFRIRLVAGDGPRLERTTAF